MNNEFSLTVALPLLLVIVTCRFHLKIIYSLALLRVR
jgi:hypothetical protein